MKNTKYVAAAVCGLAVLSGGSFYAGRLSMQPSGAPVPAVAKAEVNLAEDALMALMKNDQAAFERFIKAGGGFVGIHAAADTEYDWPWYTKMVGHMFHIHPLVQTATIKVEDPNFPGMDRFPKRFLATEEWYEYDAARSKLHYLLSVDETTYKPEANWGTKSGKGMGKFHPIAWYQEYDGGRAFYTGLGHLPATYSDASFLHHIYGGIYWAATGNGFTAQ